MKRLVWLLLAVFCTALAQVQPVDSTLTKAEKCPCCEVPGACGMPDCGLPPPSATAGLFAEQPTRTAQPEVRRDAARLKRVALIFLSALDAIDSAAVAFNATSRIAPVAPVPLYAAHCSFLI